MKDEKVPAETVLLGTKEFQWSMTQEKKRILKSSSGQEINFAQEARRQKFNMREICRRNCTFCKIILPKENKIGIPSDEIY